MLARMQSVVQPRGHADRIPERGVRRDVLDAITVKPDLAAVLQTRDVLVTGHRSGGEVLRTVGFAVGGRIDLWRSGICGIDAGGRNFGGRHGKAFQIVWGAG